MNACNDGHGQSLERIQYVHRTPRRFTRCFSVVLGLVNERIALSRAPVQAAFAQGGIVYLKGDWTRQDPAITAYLRANGAVGVPLYVFYPAGNKPALILPQILTPSIVLDAIGAV